MQWNHQKLSSYCWYQRQLPCYATTVWRVNTSINRRRTPTVRATLAPRTLQGHSLLMVVSNRDFLRATKPMFKVFACFFSHGRHTSINFDVHHNVSLANDYSNVIIFVVVVQRYNNERLYNTLSSLHSFLMFLFNVFETIHWRKAIFCSRHYRDWE